MHILHLPRFWKHKETNEVIDHLTYSDLKEPHSSNFEECDVTGELLSDTEQNKKDILDNLAKAPENTGEPTVIQPMKETDVNSNINFNSDFNHIDFAINPAAETENPSETNNTDGSITTPYQTAV